MDDEHRLHVVLIPWLAMGHIIPFFELSKLLAQKGIRISFISTPKNIQRLPKIPPNISSLINLVSLPLPQVDNLPEHAECTIDLPVDKVQYLKKAFDGLQVPLASFLENSIPNWIIYDFAGHWLPPMAARLGVPCAFLSLVNAATLAWSGPPSVLLGTSEDPRKTIEDALGVPKWVPFPSNIVFRLHEILRLASGAKGCASGVQPGHRLGLSIQGSDAVLIRSCSEFESEWIHLVEDDIYKKPLISIGLLPPSVEDKSNDIDENWEEIRGWLDKHKPESIVYVAIGTEATLSQEDMTQLALGLERSQLPFFWVLRKLPGEEQLVLPEGFEDRTSGRGYVCQGWAPQVRILAHPSVGGFLTHCGWNSIIESLGFGRVLILLPFILDQGLNARMLAEKKIGVEIPRDERYGSFTRDDVASTLRMVMVDEGGETFRAKAREMRDIFGSRELHDGYINNFVEYLCNYKHEERLNFKQMES